MATPGGADRAHFDRHAREEGEFDPFTAAGWAQLARHFSRAVPVVRGARLLDVGCGSGASRAVYPRDGSYIGLDLSLGGLARTAGMPVVQADAFELPFAAESVDVVAFSSVLHHLPDRAPALQEAHRVLRPGGHVFAFDPNLHHPAMALFRHPRSPFYRAAGVSPTERPLPPIQLFSSFLAAGFHTLGQRALSGISYRHVAPPLLRRLLPLYNPLDRLWETLGLGRRFGTFVLTWGTKP
jgi:SAM-dependent methyltransferase